MKRSFLLKFSLLAIACALAAPPLAAAIGVNVAMAAGLALGGMSLVSVASGTQYTDVHQALGVSASLLNAEFGAHYIDGGQGVKDLHEQLYHGAKFDKQFALVYTRQDVYDQATVVTSEVTQPWQQGFTPSGDLTFKPSRSTLQRVKIDWQHDSYKLVGTYANFLRKEGGVPESQQPITAYVLNLIAKQHVQDVELKAAYKGVYAAPTTGVAGPASTSIDGVRKKLNDAITAGTITAITTGALATDPVDFVTQMEGWADQIDELDRSQKLVVNIDDALARRFRRGMRVKYKDNNLSKDELNQFIDYPNIVVEGQYAMSGSSKFFATPEGNAVKAINVYDQSGARNRFQFLDDVRLVKAWLDYSMTYHFIDHGRVYTNEQTV